VTKALMLIVLIAALAAVVCGGWKWGHGQGGNATHATAMATAAGWTWDQG
jgi:ferric-dicitrate binding protein FerR (iron transport regulator)